MAQRRAVLSGKAASALLVASAMLLLGAAGCDNEDDDADGSAAGGSSGPPPTETAWEFTSRPDLTPPRIDVTTTAAGDEAGVDSVDDLVVLLAPKDKKDKGSPMNGPLIVDNEGDPIWIHPLGDTRWSYDLRVQRYRGKPVLTWWQGDTQPFGYGQGEFVVMDQSYREIATVTTPKTPADFHEGRLTADGTALLISYPEVEHDLSDVGGDEDGYLRDSVVYEIDIATGKVLFEWSALDHIALTDTEQVIEEDSDESGTEDAPFDPYHLNSVSVDGDAFLVSARNTHAVYRIDRRSGTIDWTLGGKSSDFEMTGDSTFAWQHDAERQRDGTITLFDNEAAPAVGEQSRGLRLDVDPAQGTASVVTEYAPPEKRLSESQGNVEVRSDGSVFVGWGSQPYYSLYTADGELLQDAELAGGISYRTYRMGWVGRPVEPPRLLLKGGRGYVSWNGATGVDRWQFVVGPDEQSAKVVETVDADGFETSAKLPDGAYVAVRGLDASGEVLATAEPGAWPVG